MLLDVFMNTLKGMILRKLYLKDYFKNIDLPARFTKNLLKVIERKNFMPESCIQNAYGWNSGAANFHTGYRPCSKYFLLNLIIADKKRLLEFKADMISSAPRAIIYEIDSGPDLNWKIFEKEVFPYQTILQICYDKAKGSDVYFAKFEGFSQGLCIRDASKKQ